jgi:hypothetical protein
VIELIGFKKTPLTTEWRGLVVEAERPPKRTLKFSIWKVRTMMRRQ